MKVSIIIPVLNPTSRLVTLTNELIKNKFNDIMKELKMENNIIDISEGNLKSLIILKRNDKLIGYISNISSNTLGRRINKNIY